MARDGLLFRAIGEIHPRYQTPHYAILMQAIWACLLVATGSYRTLVARVVYTEWIFFALMAIGLLLVRRRGNFRPVFRAPLGVALPLGFAAAALLVVLNQIVAAPLSSLTGLLLVLAGWPVFVVWTRRRNLTSTPLIADGD
jgi:APA family basic amino acid/polyamine antiporter